MLPFVILPRAQRDFDESFQWYSSRSFDVAERFAKAVDAAIRNAAQSPNLFSFLDNSLRYCRVKHFPFRVIYRIGEGEIFIVAIAHGNRRFGYWKSTN